MDGDSNSQPKFGKIRGMLFPIYSNEFRKFIPLAIIFLCISFCYSSVRMMKDTFFLSINHADTIYVLKTFFVLPMMILYTIIYSVIARKVSRDTRFNFVALYFIAFFLLSFFVLIPFKEQLQLDSLGAYLNSIAPRFSGYWAALQYWHFSLFYFHAEAWGTLMLSVAFWSFANEITSSKQAKRFYGFLSLGAAGGTYIAGLFYQYQGFSLITKLGIICAVMIIMFVSYNLMATDIRKNPEVYQIEPKVKKSKKKLSMLDSFKFLLKSKYLGLLAMIVLGYNSFISLFESTWKGSVAEVASSISAQGGNGEAYLTNMYGMQSQFSGLVQFFFVLFVSSWVSGKSWKFAALFTPVLCLLGTTIYASFVNFSDVFANFFQNTEYSPMQIGILVGLFVLVLVKSAKYVFFDTTKERAYIPLDEDSKITGKAAIDSVGSRLGKSVSGLFVSVLTPIFGGMSNIRGITTIAIFIILVLWFYSVNALSGEYEQKLAEKEEEKKNAQTERV